MKIDFKEEEIEDLKGLLKEYIEIFKKNKQHQKHHNNKPCMKCELSKRFLRKLERKPKIKAEDVLTWLGIIIIILLLLRTFGVF